MDIACDDATSGRRYGRGPGRAGRITRREILNPSAQTGKKLESLPLPEEELRSNGSAANKRLHVSHSDREEARRSTQEDMGGQAGYTGPLGRIQRSLKKMTSSELWIQQQKKRGGGEEAREFRINAEARKPQRFYLQAATPAAPIRGMPSHQSVPQRKSSLRNNSNKNEGEAAMVGPTAVSGAQQERPRTTAPRGHGTRRQTSRVLSTSSVESFTTSMEELKEFAPRSQPPPLEHQPVFSGGDLTTASELTFGRRRSHHSCSAQNGHARHSSSEDRSTIHNQQQHDAAVHSSPATALRYPPNSSRSAACIPQHRPHSSASDQQPRPSGVGSSAAQPSPTFGPSDSYVVDPPGGAFPLLPFEQEGADGEMSCRYINTSARKVNSNFEILPAGTFGLPEQHALEEPASTAASVRSSFDSQGSARKKLQKKRTGSNYST